MTAEVADGSKVFHLLSGHGYVISRCVHVWPVDYSGIIAMYCISMDYSFGEGGGGQGGHLYPLRNTFPLENPESLHKILSSLLPFLFWLVDFDSFLKELNTPKAVQHSTTRPKQSFSKKND